MDNRPFNTYSCRFELPHDFTAFVVGADKQGIQIDASELRCVNGLDIHAQFASKEDLATLQAILRNGEDLHVALQTLRPVPLKDNSLERDYDL